MKPILIAYHCLFTIDGKILPSAINIVDEQMTALKTSGLLDAASEIIVGINENPLESGAFVHRFIPAKAKVVYHGAKSRAENLTIVEIEKWVKDHQDWHVLYFHAKGSTHAHGSDYGEKVSKPWRNGMMLDLVTNWRTCVADLETHDIVCSHWMWNLADGTQHIPAGDFLWITSNFAAKLPSIYLRDRIKQDGIAALSSRYEAEVYWGNGPRPNVKSYRPDGGSGVP